MSDKSEKLKDFCKDYTVASYPPVGIRSQIRKTDNGFTNTDFLSWLSRHGNDLLDLAQSNRTELPFAKEHVGLIERARDLAFEACGNNSFVFDESASGLMYDLQESILAIADYHGRQAGKLETQKREADLALDRAHDRFRSLLVREEYEEAMSYFKSVNRSGLDKEELGMARWNFMKAVHARAPGVAPWDARYGDLGVPNFLKEEEAVSKIASDLQTAISNSKAMKWVVERLETVFFTGMSPGAAEPVARPVAPPLEEDGVVNLAYRRYSRATTGPTQSESGAPRLLRSRTSAQKTSGNVLTGPWRSGPP